MKWYMTIVSLSTENNGQSAGVQLIAYMLNLM
nr:MAG TPA: hypothetical protein [Caudoviricetes sp.]